MNGPPSAVTAVRTAVRAALGELRCPAGTPLLVACSGGADSTALVLAAAAESVRAARQAGGAGQAGGARLARGARLAGARPPVAGDSEMARTGAPARDPSTGRWPVRAAVIDHGLQAGSAERAEATVALLAAHGVPGEVLAVRVSGGGGLEAAARRARYAALRAARPSPDSPVLLGHTLDDQAESVLLGLGRGSGPRSLAGMTRYDPPWLRPLLGLRRSVTRAACAELGVPVWDDPHNADPRFTRVRLRAEVLPLLEEVLAGGVAEALARTAAQLREDCAALDDWAALVVAEVTLRADAHPGAPSVAGYTELAARELAGYPPSVRRRVLRCWLANLGVPALTDAQLRRADELVGRWRGQGGLALPGGLVLSRRHERLQLTAQAIRQPSTQPARGDEEEPGVVRR